MYLPDADDAEHAEGRRLDLLIINIVCVPRRILPHLRPVACRYSVRFIR